MDFLIEAWSFPEALSVWKNCFPESNDHFPKGKIQPQRLKHPRITHVAGQFKQRIWGKVVYNLLNHLYSHINVNKSLSHKVG